MCTDENKTKSKGAKNQQTKSANKQTIAKYTYYDSMYTFKGSKQPEQRKFKRIVYL